MVAGRNLNRLNLGVRELGNKFGVQVAVSRLLETELMSSAFLSTIARNSASEVRGGQKNGWSPILLSVTAAKAVELQATTRNRPNNSNSFFLIFFLL